MSRLFLAAAAVLWAAAAQGWKRHGAQMVMLYPMYRMPKLDDQIETLRRFKEAAPV